MKLRFAKISKIAYPEIKLLADYYFERTRPLARPHNLEIIDLKDDDHAERYLSQYADTDKVIVLDEYGKEPDSLAFAQSIQKTIENPGIRTLTFLVGGPLGLPKKLKDLAHEKLALSKATFTSDLAFLLLSEQVYRAFNILKGTNYHHGKRDH